MPPRLFPPSRGVIIFTLAWRALASRTVIVRHLLGLEKAVGMTVVDPVRDERGSAFRDGPGYSTDPVNGFAFLREGYLAAMPDFKRRVTVPVLWDKKTGRIVNNSEDDICRMFRMHSNLLPGQKLTCFRRTEDRHPWS